MRTYVRNPPPTSHLLLLIYDEELHPTVRHTVARIRLSDQLKFRRIRLSDELKVCLE